MTALEEPLLREPVDVEPGPAQSTGRQQAIPWWNVKQRILKHTSASSLADIRKHEDDKLMAMIAVEATIAFVQVFSVLLTLYGLWHIHYPVYAAAGLLLYFFIPAVFALEDAWKGNLDAAAALKLYLTRISAIEAISHARAAWQIYVVTYDFKKLTLEECKKSHQKIIEMKLEEDKMMRSVQHQKFEGMAALVMTLLVAFDANKPPSLSIIPSVLNTARAYALYDFTSKVVRTLEDGKTPLVAGTVANSKVKLFIYAIRLLELVLVVMATCTSHTSIKQSYGLTFCPVIFVVPLTFLLATAAFARIQQAMFTWAESFAGLFCFSGALALPWDVAIVNCSANAYYGIRLLYLAICMSLTATALTRRQLNQAINFSHYLTLLGFVLLFALLAITKMLYATARIPPKVLPCLMTAVSLACEEDKRCVEDEFKAAGGKDHYWWETESAEERGEEPQRRELRANALPDAWKPHKKLLQRGYGLFSKEHELQDDTGGSRRSLEEPADTTSTKDVEFDGDTEWKQAFEDSDYTKLELRAERGSPMAKITDFVERNVQLSKVNIDIHRGPKPEELRSLADAVAALPKPQLLNVFAYPPSSPLQLVPFLPRSKSTLTDLRFELNRSTFIRDDVVAALDKTVQTCHMLQSVRAPLAPSANNMQVAAGWLRSTKMTLDLGEAFSKGSMAWAPCAKDLKNVEEVNFVMSKAFGDDGAASDLGHVLVAAESAQVMNLTDCQLSADTLKIASDIVDKGLNEAQATTLDLSLNNLAAEEAVAAVAQLAKKCPMLIRLTLIKADLTDAALKSLVDNLDETTCQALAVLDLRMNDDLLQSKEGASALVDLVTKRRNLEVNLSDRTCSEEAKQHLVKALGQTNFEQLCESTGLKV